MVFSCRQLLFSKLFYCEQLQTTETCFSRSADPSRRKEDIFGQLFGSLPQQQQHQQQQSSSSSYQPQQAKLDFRHEMKGAAAGNRIKVF